jgi:hypothetical protein
MAGYQPYRAPDVVDLVVGQRAVIVEPDPLGDRLQIRTPVRELVYEQAAPGNQDAMDLVQRWPSVRGRVRIQPWCEAWMSG